MTNDDIRHSSFVIPHLVFLLSSTAHLPATSTVMLRRGVLLFPLLVLIAGASLIREAAVGLLVQAEEAWGGVLAKRLGNVGGTSSVTLVEISEDTLTKHSWPLMVEDFALFFNAALPFEPAVVGIEPVLAFERGVLAGGDRDEVQERMLRDGILRAPKLVLSGRLGWSQESDAVQAIQPMPVLRHVRGDLRRVPEFVAVEAWAEEDYRLSSQPGWINLPEIPGPRGKCPLIFRYRGQPVPSITLQLAMLWEKVMLDEIEVVLGSHIAIGKQLRVPIDDTGRMFVNFGVPFTRTSFDNLVLTREQADKGEPTASPPDFFKARLLYLARTDPSARTLITPVGEKISSGEFTAAALATIQAGAHPHRVGGWFDWLFVFIVAAVSPWLTRGKATRMAMILVVTEAAYLAIALAIFNAKLLALPVVLPLGLALWLLLLRMMAKRAQRVIAF